MGLVGSGSGRLHHAVRVAVDCGGGPDRALAVVGPPRAEHLRMGVHAALGGATVAGALARQGLTPAEFRCSAGRL